MYYFILKLNSDQNYIILFLLFILIVIYNNYFIYNSFIFYLFFALVVFNTKYNIFDNHVINSTVNKNLTNGLLIIHPILLYSSYAALLFIIYKNMYKKFNFIFFFSTLDFNKNFNLTTATILLLSIFLGSWWAEQELGWGGWWSWDFIEIISLNFFFITILLLHNVNYKNFFLWLELDLLFKIIIYMIIVRFNFLNSIHNFISNNFFFQFFFELIFFYIIVFFYILKLKYFNSNLFVLKQTFNYIYFLFFLLVFNIFIYVILEFLNLIYTNLNIINIFKKNKIFYYMVVYLYIFYFFRFNYNNLLFLPFYEYLYLNIFFNKNYKNYKIFILHLIIFIYIYIILFNFYFIDKNDFIAYNQINNFLCNNIFFSYNNVFLSDTNFSQTFNNSIFFKTSFCCSNIFVEFFSFNNFILLITNINTIFIIVLLFFFNLYNLYFYKNVFY